MPIKICASILSADFLRLGEELKTAEDAGCDYIHVDVMDGHFVQNMAVGLCVAKWLKKGTSLRLDAHLAVSEPQLFVKAFADAGMNALIFHAEAYPHHFRMIEQIKKHNMLAGVALSPSTGIEDVKYLLPDLDIIDLLAVNAGFPNQSYNTVVNQKIKECKQLKLNKGYDYEIQVDGGINTNTAGMAIAAGADVLILGSGLFESKDMSDVVQTIRRNE